MKKLLAVLPLVLLTGGAYAVPYTVDTTKSSIAFAGQQAGTDFKGVFEKWEAKVDFDPQKLDQSHIEVTIDTASAKTGNAMYDGTLPQDDWFDVKQFSKAFFKSTKITKVSDGNYKAEGDLTIRDVTKPIAFNFTLSPEDAKTKQVTAKSTFKVDRLAYNIGVKSDGKAEWVSQDITLDFLVIALQNNN